MKKYLEKLSKEVQDLIYLASDIASKNNMTAYLVGGFVRDLILDSKNLDLDIVIEGNGIKFAEDFAIRLQAKLIRHRRFGTATVVTKHNLKIDIASTRKELYPKAACLPQVSSGTLKDDLFRRDFTINAMAISINRKDFGRLIDFFGGRDDLRNKKMRILHDLSFIDDPTRILRAIRFEKRYNFRLDSNTLKCLKKAVKFRILEEVQPQRLRDELIQILKEKRPIKQIRRLQELVGFSFIGPRLSISKETYTLLNSIENQISWFNKEYPQRRTLDIWLIYFMGLIDSIDINYIKSICKAFVFRKGEEKRILTYKKFGPGVSRWLSQDKIKPSKIFSLLEPLSYEVILLIKAKSKNLNLQRHIEDFFEIYNGMRLHISGDDLHRLGVAPGPYYQKIFTKVLNAKLNGKIRTKEEELSLIKRLITIKK